MPRNTGVLAKMSGERSIRSEWCGSRAGMWPVRAMVARRRRCPPSLVAAARELEECSNRVGTRGDFVSNQAVSGD